MSLNWLEIDRVLEELSLSGSFIQKIVQPDFSSLRLELYAPGKGGSSLYIVLRPGKTRLHRTSRTVKRRVPLQRFAQLLRARIRGCRIVSAEQLTGQRIIRIGISRGDEPLVLWLRLWGNQANILLCRDTGEIIDAFYRRPARGEISGGYYRPEEEAFSPPPEGFVLRDENDGVDYNQLIDHWYGEEEEQALFASLQESYIRRWRRYAGLQQTRLAELERSIAVTGTSEILETSENERSNLRSIGDLLLANLHRFQKGDSWVRLESFETSEILEIPLKPDLSPQENAARYYQKHKKERRRSERAAEELNEQRAALRRAEEYLKAVETAPGLEELEALPLPPKRRGKREQEAETRPGALFFSNSWEISVGRNAKESDTLLRRWAKGNDYWIHARDYPGGHVFIRAKTGKSVPLEVLLDAGNLAIHYSKGKANGGGDCYYTQVKYLRRAKDAKTATLLPTHEKNIAISLDEARLRRLHQ